MRISLIASACVAACVAMSTAGSAVAAGDTDDNIAPAGVAVTATSTKIVFTGPLAGLAGYTIICTTSTFRFATPAAGLGPVPLIGVPAFGGCTDNLSGGAVAVVANAVTGPWTLAFADSAAANEETVAEVVGPASGDSLILSMPRNGLTFTPAAPAGCVVTATPAGVTPLPGPYDDINKFTLNGAPFSVAGNAACGATGPVWKITGSYAMSPPFHDVS